jgi:1,2-dihydroxy-3-keto-5-methylthiopentene dioxygenase
MRASWISSPNADASPSSATSDGRRPPSAPSDGSGAPIHGDGSGPSFHAPCSAEELRAEGIECAAFDPANASDVSARVGRERGLASHDDIALRQDEPQCEAKVAREADEHAHMDDEVRLIVEGSAYYDVRARDERWLRVEVAAGDLLVVPARRYHRFMLGASGGVRFVQPFAERPGLIPLYRASDDETRC